jgi:molybdopterin converting factor small subunit
MKVTVRLIGAPRIALGFKERVFVVAEGTTVADLIAVVVQEVGPKARTYLLGPGGRGYSVVFVVQGVSARPDTPIADGNEVIVMPQTAGGGV